MPAVGQRIGEYVLEEILGRGAFGEVWRARHHVWADHLVAIKVPTDSQYLRGLQREGRAIHGLVHPNIVRAMGFDPFAATPYLTMEYVAGKSLREFIREKKLTIADSVAVMKQILAGLGHAHQHGIVHGDVKPENVLISDRAAKEGFATEGVVKVTDFGLARAKAAMGDGGGSIVFSTTGEAGKEISGSLEYMSPEQRSGGEIDAKTDLYACGVVLYEMLTSERPAGTEVPSELKSAVPNFLDDAFRRAYARREKRFSTADEFSAALDARRAPHTAQLNPDSPPPLPRMMRMGPALVCSHCRKPIEPGDQFCIHCGMQLVPQVRRCNRCGAYPDLADKYCLFCGETLSTTMVVNS